MYNIFSDYIKYIIYNIMKERGLSEQEVKRCKKQGKKPKETILLKKASKLLKTSVNRRNKLTKESLLVKQIFFFILS